MYKKPRKPWIGNVTLLIVGAIAVLVVVPYSINELYFWNSGSAAGNTGDWISFFGNYFGAIIGGIVAYIVARQQVKSAERRFYITERQDQERVEGIVYTFLIEEIRENYKIIAQDEKMNKMFLKGHDLPFEHEINFVNFIFDEFNNIKYELVKYEQPIIWEALNFYRMFRILDRSRDIAWIRHSDYQFIQATYKRLKEFMDNN